mmetsp:Transcript_2527/g.8982  ORF Transcript_2527/g.8982 Transcript_2527/m.8982 type:complete len:511 (-) Transcript_2527:13-1545(-)
MAVAVAVGRLVRLVEDKEAHEVDDEAQEGDEQQLVVLHLGCVEEALERLKEHREGNEHQEHRVDEARQHVHPPVPVGEGVVGLPVGDDESDEADEEGHAVEEHVACVGDEAERVVPHAVGQLDEHEEHVEHEVDEDVARVGVRLHQLHQLVGKRRQHRPAARLQRQVPAERPLWCRKHQVLPEGDEADGQDGDCGDAAVASSELEQEHDGEAARYRNYGAVGGRQLRPHEGIDVVVAHEQHQHAEAQRFQEVYPAAHLAHALRIGPHGEADGAKEYGGACNAEGMESAAAHALAGAAHKILAHQLHHRRRRHAEGAHLRWPNRHQPKGKLSTQPRVQTHRRAEVVEEEDGGISQRHQKEAAEPVDVHSTARLCEEDLRDIDVDHIRVARQQQRSDGAQVLKAEEEQHHLHCVEQRQHTHQRQRLRHLLGSAVGPLAPGLLQCHEEAGGAGHDEEGPEGGRVVQQAQIAVGREQRTRAEALGHRQHCRKQQGVGGPLGEAFVHPQHRRPPS